MNGSRTTLWYEDLERHRQPSLYYLSSEEDPAGPHLICDWNGPPTNCDEFDIDHLSKMIEAKPSAEDGPELPPPKAGMAGCNFNEEETNNAKSNDNFSLDPALNSKTRCSQTILTENDGSRLGFLTVPPVVNSLLQRLLQNHIQNNQIKKDTPEPSKSKRPKSKPTCPSSSSSSSSSSVIATTSTGAVKRRIKIEKMYD